MNRRNFFGNFISKVLVVVGVASAFCMRNIEAASSYFRWPQYPNTEALRKHLATSSKHREVGSVKGKSRAQLISMHDRSHFNRGDKAPMRKTK